MAARRKISFLVVPEEGRLINLRLPILLFRLLVGVLGLAVVGLIVVSLFYGKLMYNSSRLRKLKAENARLLEYNARVLEIERELEKNRDLATRIASAAGIPTEKEIGRGRGIRASPGELASAHLEPHPFWEKLFPTYVGGMIPGQGTGRIPRGLPLLGYITRGFAEEPDLFKFAHTGIDVAVKEGTAVLAAASGAVEFAGWDDTYGYLVIIDHHNGYETLYGHNSNLRVSSGDLVNQADIVALSGNTGRSTGPHLHYEIWKDGKPVDPKEFF